ncbi:hypothetical protein ACROYT_G013849 [Oculina patagonica]
MSKPVAIDKTGVTSFLFVTSIDGMAIKPSLQVSVQDQGLIGLTDPPILSLEQIQQLSIRPVSEIVKFLQETTFSSQAIEAHVTSMANTISKPVAVFYAGSKGGWRSVEELFDKLRKVGYFKACLESNTDCVFSCECCLRERALCDECKGAGISVETAIEVLGPEVQRAIPSGPIVVTLIPEVYTFWRQNRPGCIECPVDLTVHEVTGRLFFTDLKKNQVMTSDFHSPSNVAVVAGTAGKPGMKDGRRAHFADPSGICIWETLLFVCDSSNGSVRVVDIEIFVSKGRRSQHAADIIESGENVEEEDCEPASDPKEKIAPVSTLELISRQRPAVCLQWPFGICSGRRMDK